jgi:myo-inositol-1(or 4)-monophosphatase
LPDNEAAAGVLALRAPLEILMREAGDIARATARTDFKRWTKGEDNSPVSEGDIAVNDFLRARLGALAPGAGWVSEETAERADDGAEELTWIVDPIDGTRAYIAGRADWTVSVALSLAGRPMLAALYAPVSDEMFLAARGQGATRNGGRMTASGGATLAGAKLAGPKRMLDRLGQLNPHILTQPKVFSLALRLTRVADGELDAAFAGAGSHAWDLAAADLLVHEAGGVMTDFAGRTLRYNRPHAVLGALIAAGRARHGTLIDLVADHMAEFA